MQEVAHKNWSPTSWKDKPVKQLPEYPDQERLDKSFETLKSLPPLVTSWEIEALKDKLANVAAGKAFLLQGGDCAESFDATKAPKIVNMVKVLLQTSFILIHEMGVPVLRVGRIAGQYAKPRSNDFEMVNGEEIHNYRGDLINGYESESGIRMPDPQRLLEGYHKAGLTLNFLRALADEGFADLHHPEQWELDFMQNNEYYAEYEDMVNSITKAVRFVESIAPDTFSTLQKVDFYTSHEALNLYYDSAQTRPVPRKKGYFNLSAHMVWLGNRTRDLDGAHVEYFKGINNPVGIKLGPPYEIDETMKLIETLNPNHEAGKIVLITRFGKDIVEKELPKLIQAVRREGFPVVWSSDPMHGNTFSTDGGIKTRNFDDILSEVQSSFAIHRSEGSYLGGVHLELTGDNVTECVGGAKGLGEKELQHNYETFCDPRLNYEQSLEMAFLVAREWKKSYS
ncbi:MAG: 3-deoxy-7-phosphoheptulonate synthase class II [Gracilimonas sp.]|uniref:class II 3-deoxy-7-phosphoheptulonate synthase n=1 Tax=Gracilimonas TaxID=649462 RepID=UPI001B01DAAF|nr:3-deoxy-7-phosphoheptulonate synthase class II [Gracilimonas sp.]MBO6585746.1 3-deoxy-7-phosphoheptulonate synthase class II [Gracilimonas sp.]MBO6616743.1 3-deoxy-7-phosphoheptulonate synthase class II [Gracilimonas sp.]